MTRMLAPLVSAVVATLACPPLAAQQQPPERFATADALRDAELARITGKFILPNGSELALSVVSDAAVDGRAVLRTVFTLDQASDLKIYARPVGSTGEATTAGSAHAAQGAGGGATAGTPGLTVMFDRQSGARLVPSVSGAGGAAVAVGNSAGAAAIQRDAAAEASARGLSEVTPVAGGPAIATADGTVTLSQLARGSAVALSGDRYGVLQLVGRSVAAATVNSANDRVLDSVTDVAIDVRNVTPYTVGSAMMRADALALDVATRMVR